MNIQRSRIQQETYPRMSARAMYRKKLGPPTLPPRKVKTRQLLMVAPRGVVEDNDGFWGVASMSEHDSIHLTKQGLELKAMQQDKVFQVKKKSKENKENRQPILRKRPSFLSHSVYVEADRQQKSHLDAESHVARDQASNKVERAVQNQVAKKKNSEVKLKLRRRQKKKHREKQKTQSTEKQNIPQRKTEKVNSLDTSNSVLYSSFEDLVKVTSSYQVAEVQDCHMARSASAPELKPFTSMLDQVEKMAESSNTKDEHLALKPKNEQLAHIADSLAKKFEKKESPLLSETASSVSGERILQMNSSPLKDGMTNPASRNMAKNLSNLFRVKRATKKKSSSVTETPSSQTQTMQMDSFYERTQAFLKPASLSSLAKKKVSLDFPAGAKKIFERNKQALKSVLGLKPASRASGHEPSHADSRMNRRISEAAKSSHKDFGSSICQDDSSSEQVSRIGRQMDKKRPNIPKELSQSIHMLISTKKQKEKEEMEMEKEMKAAMHFSAPPKESASSFSRWSSELLNVLCPSEEYVEKKKTELLRRTDLQ